MNPYIGMDTMYLENEIRACQHVLSDSDSEILSVLEGLLTCTTATAVTNYLKAVPESVKETLAYRTGIRERMNLMKAALNDETDDDPDPEAEPESTATPESEGE